eukprot:TRINITY_DN2032_c0_g1_i6.p1 TRINITY_DN2032_c0_g1~~TRINITY_DN2032_c0_g1_i6.p1  ORF type:complete len:607 (-),score=127.58 TRINITY_DN2032_c0_g1_i6:195-2015(-)
MSSSMVSSQGVVRRGRRSRHGFDTNAFPVTSRPPMVLQPPAPPPPPPAAAHPCVVEAGGDSAGCGLATEDNYSRKRNSSAAFENSRGIVNGATTDTAKLSRTSADDPSNSSEAFENSQGNVNGATTDTAKLSRTSADDPLNSSAAFENSQGNVNGATTDSAKLSRTSAEDPSISLVLLAGEVAAATSRARMAAREEAELVAKQAAAEAKVRRRLEADADAADNELKKAEERCQAARAASIAAHVLVEANEISAQQLSKTKLNTSAVFQELVSLTDAVHTTCVSVASWNETTASAFGAVDKAGDSLMMNSVGTRTSSALEVATKIRELGEPSLATAIERLQKSTVNRADAMAQRCRDAEAAVLRAQERASEAECLAAERLAAERLAAERLAADRMAAERESTREQERAKAERTLSEEAQLSDKIESLRGLLSDPLTAKAVDEDVRERLSAVKRLADELSIVVKGAPTTSLTESPELPTASPAAVLIARAAARLVVTSSSPGVPLEVLGEFRLVEGVRCHGMPVWKATSVAAKAAGASAVCLQWMPKNGGGRWAFAAGIPVEGDVLQATLVRCIQPVLTSLPDEVIGGWTTAQWGSRGDVLQLFVLRG